MLGQFCCTVAKRRNLVMRMRQRSIGWSVVWYIFTIYVHIIYYYTQNISRHKFNLTWSLKPIPLDLCSDACSTELASLTKEWCQGTQTCAWMLGTELVWASPNVTLYVLSTSTLVQLSLTFNFLGSSVASLSFFFQLNHKLPSSAILLWDKLDVHYCVMVFWFKI